MLNVAFILPSLANRGPVLVARDLSAELRKLGHSCTVFYFDQLEAIEFEVPVQQIVYKSKFDFSGFDIVHSHGLRPDRYVYKNRRSIAAVTLSTMHNIVIEEYRAVHSYLYAWLIQLLWTKSLKHHDALVCLNEEMKNYYLKFFKKKPITVVYNGRNITSGSDLPSADIEHINQFKKNHVIIGSACLVTKRKGLHQIINALPALPEMGFMLIGEGPELQQLKEQARLLGVADRCLFLGARLQASSYYRYFDLFVMASYAEGMPLALLEAAAMQIPAVCSNIAVLKEILTEEQTCFFELDDTGSLISAVKKLMAGSDGYATRIKALYDEKFTGRAMALNYQKVYQKLTTKTQLI